MAVMEVAWLPTHDSCDERHHTVPPNPEGRCRPPSRGDSGHDQYFFELDSNDGTQSRSQTVMRQTGTSVRTGRELSRVSFEGAQQHITGLSLQETYSVVLSAVYTIKLSCYANGTRVMAVGTTMI